MCEEHSPFSTLQSERIAAGRPKRRMDITLIGRVLEESRGTPLREIIPSTMGEPLVYKHMDEIIDLCSQYGVKLNLTTNGTFPGRGARAWAERIVPVASDVKISWIGNLNEQSLYDIWQSPAYRTLLETYLSHSLCRGCNMRRPEQV